MVGKHFEGYQSREEKEKKDLSNDVMGHISQLMSFCSFQKNKNMERRGMGLQEVRT